MKQAEFLAMLETARAVSNFYKSKFPYNLGYHHEDGSFSFDCWNLIKAILSGWNPNIPINEYIHTKQLVTGDVTGLQLLQKCTSRSRNFSKLCIPGTYLYLESDPHSGIYIGDKVVDGKTVNVIECTACKPWKVSGVVYSYVDAAGRRFNYKGGRQSLAWSEHGLLTLWVEYEDIPEIPKYNLEKFRADVRSILGVRTNEEAFNKTITISTTCNKHNALVTPLERYFKELGYYTGKIEADEGNKQPDFGSGMKEATKSFQRFVVGSTGKDVDGIISKRGYTWDTLLRK